MRIKTLHYTISLLLIVLGLRAHSQSTDIWLDSDDTTVTDICVDTLNCFNVHVSNKLKTISFIKIKGKNSVEVGRYKSKIHNVAALRLQDLNGDGVCEIMAATGRNMNGNQWFDVYMYLAQKNTVAYCGSITTDYEINTTPRAIDVTYVGSWYMEVYKERHIWCGNKLLPEKMISIELKDKSMECDSVYVDIYKSVPARSGKLRRISRILCNSGHAYEQYAWDHFFDK